MSQSRKPRIYVSGPMAGAPGSSYTSNIRDGIDAAEALERLGAVPYLPHVMALWGIVYPKKDWRTVIERDLAWVEACDALVRLPGESKGTEMEVLHARGMGKPVFSLEFAIDGQNIVTYPVGVGDTLRQWILTFGSRPKGGEL